jgi:hypothetical protein|tara:strand:- start:80 stop:415 length:336 start_codon:yes stop_codon:yes gene_type:complete
VDPKDFNSEDEDEVNEYLLYKEKQEDDEEEGEEEGESSHGGLRISKNTSELIKDIIDLFNQKVNWSMGDILHELRDQPEAPVKHQVKELCKKLSGRGSKAVFELKTQYKIV